MVEGEPLPPAYNPASLMRIGERRLVIKPSVVVGVGWNQRTSKRGEAAATAAEVDLDLSCLCFDESGAFVESVYFGNVANENDSISHTGDNTTGAGDGNDEEIILKLKRIPAHVHSLVLLVNSYNGDSFERVKDAYIELTEEQHPNAAASASAAAAASDASKLAYLPLASVAAHHNAIIMGKLYRATLPVAAAAAGSPGEAVAESASTESYQSFSSNDWVFHALGVACEGRTFGSLIPLCQQQLLDLYPRLRIDLNQRVVVMTKGETIDLHSSLLSTLSRARLDSVMIGLGWDMMGHHPIDLDVSCVAFDARRQEQETVYFGNLKSRTGAIRHGGDNRTGAGDGDDERIYIDLALLPPSYRTLYIIVNSYTGEPLSVIKNAYVRLVNTRSGQELVRFELSNITSNRRLAQNTAMLMCKLFRRSTPAADASSSSSSSSSSSAASRPGFEKEEGWMMKSLGVGMVGRVYKDNLNEMQREMLGRLKDDKSSYRYVVPKALLHRPQSPPLDSLLYLFDRLRENTHLLLVVIIVLLCFILFTRSPTVIVAPSSSHR